MGIKLENRECGIIIREAWHTENERKTYKIYDILPHNQSFCAFYQYQYNNNRVFFQGYTQIFILVKFFDVFGCGFLRNLHQSPPM
jgi:hypothetical protein